MIQDIDRRGVGDSTPAAVRPENLQTAVEDKSPTPTNGVSSQQKKTKETNMQPHGQNHSLESILEGTVSRGTSEKKQRR